MLKLQIVQAVGVFCFVLNSGLTRSFNYSLLQLQRCNLHSCMNGKKTLPVIVMKFWGVFLLKLSC